MELKGGTRVFTNDGKDVGCLRQVVVDPENNEVTHIVIAKGFLLPDNKVVPIEDVVSATDGRIDLDCSSQVVDEMSPLDIESNYPEREVGDQSRTYIPAIGGFYMNPVILPAMSTDMHRSIASNLVALEEGVDVTSDDDEHLGIVERYFTAVDKELVDYFIVSDGILEQNSQIGEV